MITLLHLLLLKRYDVWLVDWRVSCNLPSMVRRDYTLDDCAAYDYPAAINKVIELTKQVYTPIPRGWGWGLSCKKNGGVRQKFWKEPLRDTKILCCGCGSKCLLPLRRTNCKTTHLYLDIFFRLKYRKSPWCGPFEAEHHLPLSYRKLVGAWPHFCF